MQPQDDIAYQILRSIRRILRKTSEHSRQLLQEAGLTVPQLLCLRAIAGAEGAEITVASVSQLVGLSAPTTSRILDRLELAGFIVRERRSVDRRKVCLRLTRAGSKQLAKLPTPLHEEFLLRLKKLRKAERLNLLQALEQIVVMMEASDLDAAPILTPGSETL